MSVALRHVRQWTCCCMHDMEAYLTLGRAGNDGQHAFISSFIWSGYNNATMGELAACPSTNIAALCLPWGMSWRISWSAQRKAQCTLAFSSSCSAADAQRHRQFHILSETAPEVASCAGGIMEKASHAINFNAIAYLELLGLAPWYLPPTAHR